MSDDTTTGNGSVNGNNNGKSNGGAAQSQNQSFMLQQLYVKDLSFEAPHAPQIFNEAGIEPETELNIRNSHSDLGDHQYEVVLHISVHAKQDDRTIFLAELDQGGVFLLQGYTPEQTTMLLGTQCPTTLFPYARETISTLVGKGGFPPLILQPINFESLYARARDQQAAQA